jgi:type VI secretion system secreted protein Hcp
MTMAVDMFLKIAAIKGESKDAKHKDEIEVLSWSWGMSQSGSAHFGSGAGAGKVSVQDLNVTKYVDKSSHILAGNCCKGTHMKEATLFVRKAGDKPLEYLKITMTDCMITAVQTGGSGHDDRLTENVTLNFAKFKYEYTPQKPDGSGDSTVDFTFDIAANEAEK